MKTLADFKRRLVAGLSVRVTFPSSVINGNTGKTVIPGREITRRVESVSPSRVVWEGGSSLYWPKADCIRFVDENTAAISHRAGGEPFATYYFFA